MASPIILHDIPHYNTRRNNERLEAYRARKFKHDTQAGK